MLKWKCRYPWIGALLSGILLTACYPGLERSELAWVALVPLIVAGRKRTSRQAFQIGYVAGVTFWLLSIYWIFHVTVLGWIALSLYCALYFGLFSWFTGCWFTWAGTASWVRNLGYVVVAPAVWVSLEYARSHLFTGFAWNTLAISQYNVLPLRQIAQWGGVYAVSAVLVTFNAGVAATLLRYADTHTRLGRGAHPELYIGFLTMALAVTYGIHVVRDDRLQATPVHVGIIQTGIPQINKWTDETVPLIYRRLTELTQALHASGSAAVDLIVWPETAVPDDVCHSDRSYSLVKSLAEAGSPILVGSMDVATPENSPTLYYNSSFLFERDGTISSYYDKRHLVMFGEYIPLERIVPFLNAMTPNLASFTPGKLNTVFRLENPDIAFSPLICFEDSIPELSRKSVREGARLLVNQTNDAWFERSSAARQHMAHCVFRCVEHRVPAVRSANTGVSCMIDHLGVIRSEWKDAMGDPFGPGWLDGWVLVPLEGSPPTFYTKYGDVFAGSCMGVGIPCFVVGMISPLLTRKNRAIISKTEDSK